MRDFARFLTLIAGVLFSLFVVWFGLRSYGQNRPPSSYQTPLVRTLVERSHQAPILWSSTDPSFPIVKTTFTGSWNTDQQKPLVDELRGHQDRFLLLFFEGRDPKALPSLRKLIKEEDLQGKIIFCSRQDGLLKDLRDLEPQWTFCSGEAYMVRLLAFSSLGLESLLEISSDVVFVHMTAPIANQEVEKIITEGKRQNKLVVVGPVTRPLEGLSPHGWMVENKDPKVQ